MLKYITLVIDDWIHKNDKYLGKIMIILINISIFFLSSGVTMEEKRN